MPPLPLLGLLALAACQPAPPAAVTVAGRPMTPAEHVVAETRGALPRLVELAGHSGETYRATIEPRNRDCAYARAMLADLTAGRGRLDRTLPLVITGHSLGGAVGMLLGLYLAQPPKPYLATEVVTYGQPRALDAMAEATFGFLLDATVTRVVSCAAPVPLVPTAEAWIENAFGVRLFRHADDYVHVGRSVLLTDERRYWTQRHGDFPRDRVTELKRLAADVAHRRTIDHAMARYDARLRLVPGGAPSDPAQDFRCSRPPEDAALAAAAC